jgi:uncharacterized protein
MTAALSNREARWLAVEAQGLGRHRPSGRIDRRHLRSVVADVGAIQVDAVNVLARTQFLVPFSRIGAYDPARLLALAGPGGELFEYWGHAASLLPVAFHPLLRWRMAQHGTDAGHGAVAAARYRAWADAHADYLASVLADVAMRGPIPASQLADPRRRDGEWWERRSVGRQALEWLFARGELAAWRTPNFERVYDLPERFLPADVLAAPTPTVEDAHRQLLLLATRSHGVGTVGDLADYYRISRPAARQRVAELVEAGSLVEVAVEGGRQTAYLPPTARSRRPRRRTATLLSPFDSLIWERDRAERLFGVEFRIEIYVPGPKRRWGYYVLPLLVGDEVVARFDLKADRAAGVLRVQAAHLEEGTDEADAASAAAAELASMAGWLGLTGVVVGERGALAPALARAVA